MCTAPPCKHPSSCHHPQLCTPLHPSFLTPCRSSSSADTTLHSKDPGLFSMCHQVRASEGSTPHCATVRQPFRSFFLGSARWRVSMCHSEPIPRRKRSLFNEAWVAVTTLSLHLLGILFIKILRSHLASSFPSLFLVELLSRQQSHTPFRAKLASTSPPPRCNIH